jgi:DNA-directed RNA polymerase alpha subunit
MKTNTLEMQVTKMNILSSKENDPMATVKLTLKCERSVLANIMDYLNESGVSPTEIAGNVVQLESANVSGLSALNLSIRSMNALSNANITDIAQLKAMSNDELKALKGIGTTVINDINSALGTPIEQPDVITVESSLTALGLSNRAIKALGKAGVKNIKDFNNLSSQDVQAIRGIGANVVDEIWNLKKSSIEIDNVKAKIADLNFSNRTRNSLLNAKIDTVGKLFAISDDDLRKTKGVGASVVYEVRDYFSGFSPSPKSDKKENTKVDLVKTKIENSVNGYIISALDLSNRSRNAVNNLGIRFVEDLRVISDDELSAMKGIGKTVVEDIHKSIEDFDSLASEMKEQYLYHSIATLEVSQRYKNALAKAGVNFVEEVTLLSDDELTAIKGVSPSGVVEIKTALLA